MIFDNPNTSESYRISVLTPETMENVLSNSNPNLTECPNTSQGKNKKKNGSRSQTVKLSTDPQSVAARNRRHRISDRFKILQSMVPGGTKMDTASMLEEAINYVKFLKAVIWFHENVLNSVDHHEEPVASLPDSFPYFPERFYSNITNLTAPAEQYPVQASEPPLVSQDFNGFQGFSPEKSHEQEEELTSQESVIGNAGFDEFGYDIATEGT